MNTKAQHKQAKLNSLQYFSKVLEQKDAKEATAIAVVLQKMFEFDYQTLEQFLQVFEAFMSGGVASLTDEAYNRLDDLKSRLEFEIESLCKANGKSYKYEVSEGRTTYLIDGARVEIFADGRQEWCLKASKYGKEYFFSDVDKLRELIEIGIKALK
jgi:hypothetical protein